MCILKYPPFVLVMSFIFFFITDPFQDYTFPLIEKHNPTFCDLS